MEKKICRYVKCKKEFIPENKRRRYCDDTCKMNAKLHKAHLDYIKKKKKLLKKEPKFCRNENCDTKLAFPNRGSYCSDICQEKQRHIDTKRRRLQKRKEKVVICAECNTPYHPFYKKKHDKKKHKKYCSDKCRDSHDLFVSRLAQKKYQKTDLYKKSIDKTKAKKKIIRKAFVKMSPRRNQHYTEEEIKIIKDISLTSKDVALMIGRTETGISYKRKSMGISRRKKYKMSKGSPPTP